MKSNALAVAAMVVVGVFIWVVTAWPAPGEDAALESLQPLAVEPAAREPAPAPAEKPAAVAPAPPKAPPPPAAAAEVAAQEPAPTDQEEPQASPEPFAKEQGPVAEYRRIYESEPRDSAATEFESAIRGAFPATDGAPELLRSVMCRQTICKLDLYWSPARMGAYVAGVTRAMGKMERGIGVAPAGPLGADGSRPLEVYFKRPQAEAAAPAATP